MLGPGIRGSEGVGCSGLLTGACLPGLLLWGCLAGVHLSFGLKMRRGKVVLCVIFGPRHLTECTGSRDPHMLAELGWGRSLAGGVPAAAAAGEILHRTQIIAVGVNCVDLLCTVRIKTWICIPHANAHCTSLNRHMWHLHGCRRVLRGGIT